MLCRATYVICLSSPVLLTNMLFHRILLMFSNGSALLENMSLSYAFCRDNLTLWSLSLIWHTSVIRLAFNLTRYNGSLSFWCVSVSTMRLSVANYLIRILFHPSMMLFVVLIAKETRLHALSSSQLGSTDTVLVMTSLHSSRTSVPSASLFSGSSTFCHYCKRPGHKKTQCPKLFHNNNNNIHNIILLSNILLFLLHLMLLLSRFWLLTLLGTLLLRLLNL